MVLARRGRRPPAPTRVPLIARLPAAGGNYHNGTRIHLLSARGRGVFVEAPAVEGNACRPARRPGWGGIGARHGGFPGTTLANSRKRRTADAVRQAGEGRRGFARGCAPSGETSLVRWRISCTPPRARADGARSSAREILSVGDVVAPVKEGQPPRLTTSRLSPHRGAGGAGNGRDHRTFGVPFVQVPRGQSAGLGQQQFLGVEQRLGHVADLAALLARTAAAAAGGLLFRDPQALHEDPLGGLDDDPVVEPLLAAARRGSARPVRGAGAARAVRVARANASGPGGRGIRHTGWCSARTA